MLFSPLSISIYTWLMRSHQTIITAAKWITEAGQVISPCSRTRIPAQTLRKHNEIYRPHSAGVKLHLLNWNIPPSVIQYALVYGTLCGVITFDRCKSWWYAYVHVYDNPHVPCFCMQRSKRWPTARQHCNWATRCWSIPAFSTLRHLHTNKLHVLKTITQHVITVSRALIAN